MRLTEADHRRVSDAVAAAEAHTSGEIVTIVARSSDAYHDVALHWSVVAMLLALAIPAAWPAAAIRLVAPLVDPWSGPVPPSAAFAVALILAALVFLAARLALSSPALRLSLTPPSTKARRVRRQAMALFRAGAEQRTTGATGVLLYLSVAEHRAEIVADAGIHARVAPELWGEAMAVLVAAVKDGRPGDGLAQAIARIGTVLAEHFPRSDDDVNELPDRLIEL